MTTIGHDLDTQHRHLSEGRTVHPHLAQTAPVGPALLRAPAQRELPCREHPADLWFAELPEDVELAKELCLTCPLLEACLAGALERREPWGVWGGQLVLQGRVVPRKRPRGRPRKEAA